MSHQSLANVYPVLAAEHPPWFAHTSQQRLDSLNDLPAFSPHCCRSLLALQCSSRQTNQNRSDRCVDGIFPSAVSGDVCDGQRSGEIFGVSVAAALRRPPCHVLDTLTHELYLHSINFEHCDSLHWISLPATDLVRRLERLSKQEIIACLRTIPSSVRPTYNSRYRRQCCSSLVQHIQHRASYLFSLSDYQFFFEYSVP
ncbi:hypothetical protein EV424DRAFT_1397986 [Suillus variegatus]|nr:hypothetical protein EV424DRAFT_1397986 [Suillus variegatus]